MTSIALPRRKAFWRRHPVVTILIVLILLVAVGYGSVAYAFRGPSKPFDQIATPPAPDYARPEAWQAFPGRNGIERSTPPGFKAIDEHAAAVDVFFIHPTTFLKNSVWNAPFNAPDDVAKLNPPVSLAQIGAFNGCCRLYAPHYRQATLAGLGDKQAAALAYSDVARAFRHFIEHESNGRPFILASHSQGTAHAIELLQREILGTPLQGRMIAAYLIGGYVPHEFAQIGLPVCDAPRQTGCVISWNTTKAGWSMPRNILTKKVGYWWQGAPKIIPNPGDPVCVNPLDWRANGSAPAEANAGGLPFPEAPYPSQASTLKPLVPHLTGATCKAGMLEVSIPSKLNDGFEDLLSRLLGVYHKNDYDIFYANIRQNAIDRTEAWFAQKGK